MSTSFRRSFSSALVLACVIFSLIVGFSQSADAQQNPTSVDPKRLAVDVVSVRGVGRLHGIVLEQSENSVSIVVNRKWLKETHPKFWKEHSESETKAMNEGREKLKSRIAKWRTEHKGEDGLAISDFLDENERMLGLDKPLDLSMLPFTIVSVEGEKKRRVYKQTEERHRLAGIGWSENIEGVESMTATVLKRKINDQGLDIDTYDLKLGNQIPPTIDSDEKWEARKGLVEFALLSRLEYQGVGEMYARRGTEANPLQALTQMMQGGGGFSQINQLGKELGLPEFQDRRAKSEENAWLKRMIRTAEKEGRRSFSVSSLTQGETVSVSTTLYIKALDKQWYPMKEFTASENLRDQSTDEIEQIMQDPQIARIVDIAKQFGLSGKAKIEEAMRSGVATKKALESSMAEMEKFVEGYSFEIDNPPIQ